MDPDRREKILMELLAKLAKRFGERMRLAFDEFLRSGAVPNIETLDVETMGSQILANMIASRGARVFSAYQFTAPGLGQLRSEVAQNWRGRVKGARMIVLDTVDQIVQTPSLAEGIAAARIGRRRVDEIRQAALDLLSQSLESGAGQRAGQMALRDRLVAISKDGKFPLQINRTSPLQAPTRFYRPEDYAELVAVTTNAEAEQVAYFDQAAELKTTFVKMPYFAVDYGKKKDHVCARINGKIFSLKPEGEYGPKSGEFRPYLYGEDGLGDTGYTTAHPYCRHVARPLPAELA